MVKLPVLALVLAAGTAQAGYIETKTEWDGLDRLLKIGYVTGYVDGFSTKFTDDGEAGSRYKGDLAQCLIDTDVRGGALADIVEKGYEDLDNWSKGPTEVLLSGLHRVCWSKMNAYRAARGEDPLPDLKD